jgi:son of sevenless-like protein
LHFLSDLEQKMASEKSHKRYREILRDAEPPAIPFLGVYLTDLTFVGDGNPDVVDGKHNFMKRRLAIQSLNFTHVFVGLKK